MNHQRTYLRHCSLFARLAINFDASSASIFFCQWVLREPPLGLLFAESFLPPASFGTINGFPKISSAPSILRRNIEGPTSADCKLTLQF
jgi:hypothetical protein